MGMEPEMDKAKGRLKKAAGDLTDDDELRRSGQVDEAGGKMKEAVRRGKDKVDDAIDDIEERFDRR